MVNQGTPQPGGKERLTAYGWDSRWEEEFLKVAQPGDEPGRVAAVFGPSLRLVGPSRDRDARLAGSFQREWSDAASRPTTGDWVVARENAGEMVVAAVLPRRTACERTAPNGRIQVVAANVDRLFIVMGVDSDFNPRRLERYLLLAFASGASPVVLLNKIDLSDALAERIAELEPLLQGVPAHAISALKGDGMAQLDPYLQPATTAALLGSSGAGKSTLVNRLLGHEAQKTCAVRDADGRGRHTTTHRELFLLDNGSLLLDTPGLREVQLSGRQGGVESAFADIEELSAECRFRDCRHTREPGCAVLAAVDSGELPAARLASYRSLAAEQQRQRDLEELGAARLERKRWKAIQTDYRNLKKKK